ncbi:MAG TPA: serine hydrolase [Candidatus Dormibacteraeota bacterium]
MRSEQDSRRRFYAASTIKVAVMIAVFRLVDQRALGLDHQLEIATTFPSAIDAARFELDPDDVDVELAAKAGQGLPVGDLVERMITVSSNEATNLLMGLVGIPAVARVLAELGAGDSLVGRLIGDRAAKEAGISNEVTPADLAQLLTAMASGRAASQASCQAMLVLLERQRYRDEIPAALPRGTRVGSKNGWVDGILHDAALVWPDDAEPFCLVVCTEGFPSQDSAREAIRAVASWTWLHRLRS